MTKASDNAFPSILITEGTEPTAPAAGKQRLYIDSTTHKLKRTDSSGTDVTIEASGSGSVATDTIWDAAGDLVQGTGADTAARLAIGASGTFLQSTGSAAAWHAPKTPVSYYRRTAGDYTLNNTSWTAVDATNMNRTIAAVAGDVIEVTLLSRWDSAAVNAFLDVATIVSGSPVNWLGGAGGASDFGITGWLGLSGVAQSFGGSAFYTVQAGDISGGNVVFRVMYRTSAATNRILKAGSSTDSLFYAVKNLGQ